MLAAAALAAAALQLATRGSHSPTACGRHSRTAPCSLALPLAPRASPRPLQESPSTILMCTDASCWEAR